MDRIPYATPPRWWSPRLNPLFMRLLRPVRRRRLRHHEHLAAVDVRGLDHVRRVLKQGHGVLITAKHVGHVDAFILLAAGDLLACPFYYLVGWQVFHLLKPLERWVLRRHGAFSIDREGTDLRALRQAVAILAKSRHPLVMFPEGEIYHNNEWVAPFRSGTASIALMAARRSQRPISCIPTAIKYEYVDDPQPRLERLMDALEQRILWRPRVVAPLAERLRTFAEVVLCLREMEYLGRLQSGALSARTAALAETIVGLVSERQGVRPAGALLPERVTVLRQHAIKKREGSPPSGPEHRRAVRDLEDLEVAVQLYSYVEDFTATRPLSIDRLAEVLDKYEEDVLGAPTASLRGDRRGIIAFGEPIQVKPGKRNKDEVQALTQTLERGVLEVLDEVYDGALLSGRSSSVGADPR